MDLRQYLIAPHERSIQQHDNPIPYHQQQPAVRTLNPRLRPIAVTNLATSLNYDQPPFSNTRSQIEISHHDERSQLSQQQPQQNLPDGVVAREQVIRGLTAYPDILAAILRSNHIPDRTSSDIGSSRHHSDTPSTASQVATSPSRQIDATTPFQQTTHISASTAASAPAPPPSKNQPLPISTTPLLCFWYYHHDHCVNDPTSPNYKPSGCPCLFLHSTDGMQEIRVQPGKDFWHRRIGDCGFELCKFSSNYKHTEEIDLNLQQKKDYRKWKSEVKRQARVTSSADEATAMGVLDDDDGGGGSEMRGREKDISPSSQSNISHGEQNNQDTAPTTHNLAIPTSPKAGRYAKGSRAQQFSASTPVSTPSTLKRKASAFPSQNTPTPTSKKDKTSIPATQITTSLPPASSTVAPLTKSAAKRLKRAAKKAIENATPITKNSTTSNQQPSKNLHYSNTESLNTTTIKSCVIFPYTTSSPSNPTTIPSFSRSDKTCFAWYHNICPKRGKKCKDLHALTQPPNFVVTPRDYVHERGVCGRDWCSGDWRPELGDGVEEDFGESDGRGGEEECEKEADMWDGDEEDID
jgi:hypothetical protein